MMLTMINISGSNHKYTQFNNPADVSILGRRFTHTLRVCKIAQEGTNDTKRIISSIPIR